MIKESFRTIEVAWAWSEEESTSVDEKHDRQKISPLLKVSGHVDAEDQTILLANNGMRKHTVKLNEQRKLNFKHPMTSINAKFYFLVDNND